MATSKVNIETAKALGMVPEDFERIKEILGRIPNLLELNIFSHIWNERNIEGKAIDLIKALSKDGYNALYNSANNGIGLVDIGNGISCAFKLDTNLTSLAKGDKNDAASVIRRVNRDIISAGAKPVGLYNSHNFGDLSNDTSKDAVRKAVKFLGSYINTVGIPVLGEKVVFNESFNSNQQINVMSVGIVHKTNVKQSVFKGVGSPIYLVGSFADSKGKNKQSSNTNDNLVEKLLLEATSELFESGTVVGMQNIGTCGLFYSSFILSENLGYGLKIDIDLLPFNDSKEIHERLNTEMHGMILMVAENGKETFVNDILTKWNLNHIAIGEVIDEEKLMFSSKDKLIAEIPSSGLRIVNHGIDSETTPDIDAAQKDDVFSIDDVEEPADLKDVAWKLIQNPNVSSKRWMTEQYDTMVGTNNLSTNLPSTASVLNIKGSNKALALTCEGNPRYISSDNKIGMEIAVSKAVRNIICTGAHPVATSNCLNIADINNPEAHKQIYDTMSGILSTCEKYGVPVLSHNLKTSKQIPGVNLNNDAFTTPLIGMIGIMQNKKDHMSLAFKRKGDMIYMIGQSRDDIYSSEYLCSYHGVVNTPPPYLNLDEELELQRILEVLITESRVESVNDVGVGGIFISLLESSMHAGVGFDITTDAEVREDAFLFGEAQGRVVASVSPSKETAFIDYMMKQKLPFLTIGHVTKGELRVDDVSYGFIEDYRKVYNDALEKKLDQ